jgi:hypothetical protein
MRSVIVQEPEDADASEALLTRSGSPQSSQRSDAEHASSAALIDAVKKLGSKLERLAADVTEIKTTLARAPAGRRRQRLESAGPRGVATSPTRALLLDA